MKKLVATLMIAGMMAVGSGCLNSNYVTKETVEISDRDTVVILGDTAYFNIDNPFNATVRAQMDIVESRGIKKIVIRMFNMGGAVGDMFAIIDRLERYKENGGHITMIARGGVASAGVAIYLMGDVRYISKRAVVMIHPHSLHGEIDPDSEYYRKTTTNDSLVRMSDHWTMLYALILAKNTNLTITEALAMLKNENSRDGQTWLTALQAVELGIAHALI